MWFSWFIQSSMKLLQVYWHKRIPYAYETFLKHESAGQSRTTSFVFFIYFKFKTEPFIESTAIDSSNAKYEKITKYVLILKKEIEKNYHLQILSNYNNYDYSFKLQSKSTSRSMSVAHI